ncbi:MAG TPA: helix-turn-helix domain-containing protein [Acidimicrobiales bacterium]|nr:helix-turn-helix domain-containing protein [Acidimicrobiales bacterium]
MERSVRTRLLEAAYTCIGRYGMGKTTVEDVAREAGVSRATVYRHFPGGRDELMREVIGWETTRFFLRLADAVAGIHDFADLLEEALLYAHEAVERHAVLQQVLATEPERLLPTLTVESGRICRQIGEFLVPYLEAAPRRRPEVGAPQAADYIARMLLSWIGAPGRWDLTDRDQVRGLVRAEFLAGVLLDDETKRGLPSH